MDLVVAAELAGLAWPGGVGVRDEGGRAEGEGGEVSEGMRARGGFGFGEAHE